MYLASKTTHCFWAPDAGPILRELSCAYNCSLGMTMAHCTQCVSTHDQRPKLQLMSRLGHTLPLTNPPIKSCHSTPTNILMPNNVAFKKPQKQKPPFSSLAHITSSSGRRWYTRLQPTRLLPLLLLQDFHAHTNVQTCCFLGPRHDLYPQAHVHKRLIKDPALYQWNIIHWVDSSIRPYTQADDINIYRDPKRSLWLFRSL